MTYLLMPSHQGLKVIAGSCAIASTVSFYQSLWVQGVLNNSNVTLTSIWTAVYVSNYVELDCDEIYEQNIFYWQSKALGIQPNLAM